MDAVVRIGADVQQALRGIDRLNSRLDGVQRTSIKSAASMKALEGAASRVSAALTVAATAFAGLAVQNVVRGVIDATTRFEQFRAQLTTFLGDQRLANYELERLEKLATGLPQNVNDLTSAFVILSRNGLDTSNDSMKAFANVASATGKSVQDFALAIEDAMRGEFERVKEFGVKVTQEGDKYVARFGDQIIATDTSASRLSASLVNLGREGGRYFGAAERQANDLGTALSNLDASVEQAQRAIGEAGLARAIGDTAKQISKLLEQNPKLIQDIGVGFTKAFLYAKEAVIVLAKNIDIIGYVLAGVFGAKILAGIISFVGVIAGPMISAFVILSKVLKASALIALRHPLIGLAAVVIGGIEYLTGAISGLAEKLGLIGDDSVMSNLVDEAKELGNTIAGPVVNGLTYVSDLQERVNTAAEEYRLAMEAVNQSLTDQQAKQQLLEIAERKKQELANATRTAIEDTLKQRLEETRLAGLTAEEQARIKLEKELTNQYTAEGLSANRDLLDEYYKQTAELQKQNRLQEKTRTIINDIYEISGLGIKEELDAINAARETFRQSVEERYGILSDSYSIRIDGFEATLSLEEMLQTESYRRQQEAAEKFQDYIFGIHQTRLERQVRAELQSSKYMEQFQNGNVYQQQRGAEEMKRITAERVEFEKKSDLEKAQFAMQQGAEVFNQLGTYNKKAFEAAKAFNIANAIMNTYQGATKALATYPPPFNFIAAAAVVAMGLAQVAQIRSQSYSGRQLGGPVMNGTSYIVGENGPEMFTPTTNGSITRNGDLNTGGAVTVNFNITANDATGFDDLLLQRKGMITQMISDAMVDRGQRSML